MNQKLDEPENYFLYTYFAHCELGTLTKRCFMLILILLGNTADCKHLHIAWRDVTLQRKTPEKNGMYILHISISGKS